ncbi:MAG: response regulator [Candidatus Methylomirabilales bacterium]
MGARILVADDSVTIQKVVELTFSKEDFLLIQARSGEEALRKARAERPDLILLDLVMPDRNGYEVCEALRAEPALRTTPVVLLAGTFEALDQARASAVGVTDVVSKPFESQALISKVKQLLFARSLDAARGAPREAPRGAPAEAPAVRAPLVVPEPAPPPPEAPRGQVWPLLDAPAASERAAAVAPPPGGLPALDETGLDLELLGGEAGAPLQGAEMEVLPLPGSLSLDELLCTEAGRDAADEATPVFELPETEEPALPLIPAGPGPAASVEEPAAGASPGLPELDLASLSEELTGAAAGLGAGAGETPGMPGPVLDLAVEAAAPRPADPAGEAEASVAAPPGPAPGVPAGLEVELQAPEAAAPAGADLDGMRRAVTARVAEALAKELSQKLVERIEHVVWEVVPDLAEILIAKEIERIKQLADEQQTS